MSRRQTIRLLPFVILCGAFALRLYHLGSDSLWYDETVSLLLARSDVSELIHHTAGDIHPPLYYLLLHFWGQFAGWSEFTAAFFSLWFGVLLIALVYRVARDWSVLPQRQEDWVAMLAAFLVAFSPYNVWYSQEVRMYTLGAVLGLASMYFLRRMVSAPRILSRDFLAYVVVTELGIYTLYYFIFLIAFEYIYFGFVLFGRHLENRLSSGEQPARGMIPQSLPGGETHRFSGSLGWMGGMTNFLASQLILVLLYLPWIPVAFRQATDPPVPPWRSLVALPDVLVTTFSALVLGESVDPYASAPLLLLVLALFVYYFGISLKAVSWNRPALGGPGLPLGGMRSASIWLLAYTFIPTLLIFLLSFWTPLYHPRYIFTYSPAFYILFALAIIVVSERLSLSNTRLRYILAGVTIVVLTLASAYSLGNFWFDSQYAEDDLRGAVQHLAEEWRPGDVILVNAGYAYPALAYYFPVPQPVRVRLADYQPRPGDATSAPVVLLTGSIGGNTHLGWNDPSSDFYATTANETRAALDRVFQSHPRVWMLRIYDTVTDPQGIIREYFAHSGRLIEDQGFTGKSNVRVQGFLTRMQVALPANATKSGANLAHRLSLMGYEELNPHPRGGEFYDAVLYWQPLQTLNYNYQLSLQVLDASGQVVAQPPDETPLGQALPTSRWRVGEIYPEPVRVQIPSTLTPGDYTVIVKLYDLNSGAVLGEPLPLAKFNVGH